MLFYPALPGHQSSGFLHRHTSLIDLDPNQGDVLPLGTVDRVGYNQVGSG